MLSCRGLVVITAVAMFALPVLGQVTRSGKGYLFRARYVRGEVQRFNTHMVIPFGDGPDQYVQIGTTIKLKVAQVKDGVATVDIDTDTAKTPTKTKKIEPLSWPKHNRLKMDRMNHGVGTDNGAYLVAMFPPGPVPLKGTWSGFSTFPLGGNGGASLQTTYRLSDIQKKGHQKIAVLDVKLRGFATGSGSMLVDMADGSLLTSLLMIEIKAGDQDSVVQIRVRREDAKK
jgi:hypothetical protein